MVSCIETIADAMNKRSHSVAVITSALHAEGPQFDPGWEQWFFNFAIKTQITAIMYMCVKQPNLFIINDLSATPQL